MMRLKLPNGIVTSEQLRILAQITEDAGEGGCGDITTRQNFQLRGITLDKAPAIFEQLESCGLTTIQSGMVSSTSPPLLPPPSSLLPPTFVLHSIGLNWMTHSRLLLLLTILVQFFDP